MNKALNRLRLLLCTFSGEDDYIIRRCNAGIQFSFALIGLFVILIFIGCWASASLFMSHIFEGSKVLCFFVGIVWAMLVINLYLLLLYTISPALLPVARPAVKYGNSLNKESATKFQKPESAFTSSFIFRISLIILLATIISQPFNVLIFSPSFEASNFYAGEMRSILSSHPLAWIITSLGCILFLLPIYLKYTIRNRSGFYEKKKEIENQFVLDHYVEFKEVYATIFRERIHSYNMQTWINISTMLNHLKIVNENTYHKYHGKIKEETCYDGIAKYEYWSDHPFRTIRKTVSKDMASEADFLKDIYPENI